MTPTEDDLRRSLNRQVAVPPTAPETQGRADRAIGAARTIRRRRALAVGAAALVLAAGGVFAATRGTSRDVPLPPADPVPTVGPTPPLTDSPRLDLVLFPRDDRDISLWSAEKRGIVLPKTPAHVVKVADGWLTLGDYGVPEPSFWVRSTLERVPLPADISHVVVAPDGRRVAWRSDGRLATGTLRDGKLVTENQTPAPAEGGPLAYTGQAVYLGRPNNGGMEWHDIWVPARGAYASTPGQVGDQTTVLAPTPDGKFLAVRPGGCLVLLDPLDGLRTVKSVCGLAVGALRDQPVSPDGRYLAAMFTPADSGGASHAAVFDLGTVWETAKPLIVYGRGYDVAWESAGTLLGSDGTGLVRLRLESVEPVVVRAPGVDLGIARPVRQPG
ncbi:hypothetical protein AB0M43_14260 [Longispora sp. NPDC051575]|uniref:hypothetical protein n=1 Tax=Longispora sp. NPDC051575 TaxID=3154943 RepID=UPI00341558DB